MRSTNNRHIPAEIVEEILLNLPVKSLLRFSSASKSWHSTIFESGFVKRYRRRAALPGRERIVLEIGDDTIFKEASLISSIPSNNPAVTDFVCPFSRKESDRCKLVATCDDMWLARAGESLFLWNPSMRSFKKVPNPSRRGSDDSKDFVFGLGYESVGDDYKILRFPRRSRLNYEAELYSLRSDSWKIVQHLQHDYVVGKCVFVCGKLVYGYALRVSIICFDLLAEKFGEVAHPNCSVASFHLREACVLRGMLCLSINYLEKYCDIWVMEEYGVAESWTKKFSIQHSDSVCGFNNIKYIKPLYWYENGEILVGFSGRRFLLYRDEKTTPKEVRIGSCYHFQPVYNGFVYVDSLVAPTMLVART